MLLPVYKNPIFKVGDIIISLKVISNEYFYFTPYHEFVIISLTDSNYATIKDMNSEFEFRCSLYNDFLLKTDLKTAKKRYIEVSDEKYFKEFIHNNCPNLYEAIDDRDFYDACELKKDKYYYMANCKICDDCIFHIDKKKYENDKIVQRYLRRKKIKNINT